MILKYKLNKNIISRNAVLLNQQLNVLSGYILIQFENKNINAKSLIGLLSANLKENSEIIVSYNGDELERLKEIFDNFAVEINNT